MFNRFKRRLASYLHEQVNRPLNLSANELLYQSIFAEQCRNFSIANDFYPVGSAANYSLMFLLARFLTELPITAITEFGSGQTTILIDRLKRPSVRHVAYEHDPNWHQVVSTRLTGCDYLLCPLEAKMYRDIRHEFYSNLMPARFDLFVVDGPIGTDRFSRVGCIPFIAENCDDDVLIAFDDVQRPGERESHSLLMRALSEKGLSPQSRMISGRKSQSIIATGRFLRALMMW